MCGVPNQNYVVPSVRASETDRRMVLTCLQICGNSCRIAMIQVNWNLRRAQRLVDETTCAFQANIVGGAWAVGGVLKRDGQ